MGFIGDLFGTASGNTGGAGMRYSATGASPGQIDTAWGNTQQGLANQDAFMRALADQHGISNQSNVFQQQQALANMLQQQAAGGGPNPAQMQYQQNVNQLAQQQGAAIGAQKGINPGLAARLIAQQGSAAQQNAAGQGATLQAQQQLAAQQALMQQQAQMANLSSQQVGQTQQALSGYTQGALGQQGNVLGIQGSANSANAGVAGNVAGQQGKVFGGILQGVSAAAGMADGGMVPDNISIQNQANQGPVQALGVDNGSGNDKMQKMIQMAGKFAMAGMASGGVVPDSTEPRSTIGRGLSGFSSGYNNYDKNADPLTDGMAAFGKTIGGFFKSKPEAAPDYSSPIGDYAPGDPRLIMSQNYGANVMNLHGGVNPSTYMAPSQAAFAGNVMGQNYGMPAYAKGGAINGEAYANKMKPVPGKAKVAGDSAKNDTVPAKLSPGEVIIPRSVMQSKDPAKNAAKFVAAIMAKNGRLK